MKNEHIDFYEYGRRMANEFFDVQVAKAEEIEKKYGYGARLYFEIGMAETIGIRSDDFINDDTKLMFDKNITGKPIETLDNQRNNSYFGGTGTSHMTNRYGNYNEPEKIIKK